MPTLDLRAPSLRQQHGLMTVTVLEPFQRDDGGQQHRGRADTEALILDALRHAGRPLTRLDVARALNRAKTPHFIQILETLVAEGRVVRKHGQWRGVVMYLYEVTQ